jgi:hypothetical protein
MKTEHQPRFFSENQVRKDTYIGEKRKKRSSSSQNESCSEKIKEKGDLSSLSHFINDAVLSCLV